VAKYAVPSQLALASIDGEPTPQQFVLAKAASSQYQAEECYRYYMSALRSCDLKDKKCLKLFAAIQTNCGDFAKDSYNLLKELEL